jgi:hypothetical protein
VADPNNREAFDHWYNDDHLPKAVAAFQAVRAWRGWSEVDPSIHYANYEFLDRTHVEAVMKSEALQSLIAEFDRDWGTRAPRTREVVVTSQVRTAQND